jgi:hypothetical protein
MPAVAKKVSSPKVAIVMDDLGYNIDQMDEIFSIKEMITFSILPNLQFSRAIAKDTVSRGYETILHLPLESHRTDVKEEAGTIKTSMADKEISERINKDISDIPGLKGVSNHMGSKVTEDERSMDIILAELSYKGLYFFDSLVTDKSVAKGAAQKARVRYARRDIFLDNSNDVAAIEKELLKLRSLAFKNGAAIGVCHYRKNTVRALYKVMPEMSREGIKFVKLSELVR